MDAIHPMYLAKVAAQTCIFLLAHRALSLFWDFWPPPGSEEPRCASPNLPLSWKTLHGAVGTDMFTASLGPCPACGQGETILGCMFSQRAPAWCPLLAPPRTFSWPGPVSRLHCGQGSQQSRVPSLVSSSLLVLDCPLCAPWTHVWAVGPRIVQVVLLGLLSSPAIYQPGTANGRGQGRKERDSWSQLRTSVGLVPALEVVEDCSGIPAVENSTSLTQQTDK